MHTIGPVLDRKLKQLRPQFRAIEKGEPEASTAGRNGKKGEEGKKSEKVRMGWKMREALPPLATPGFPRARSGHGQRIFPPGRGRLYRPAAGR